MATIITRISAKIDKITQKSALILRFIGGRTFEKRATSGLYINPNRWDKDKMCVIIPRLATDEQKELVKLQKQLDDLKNFIIDEFVQADKTKLNNEWLETTIDKFHFPEKHITENDTQKPKMLLEYVKQFIEAAPQRKDKKTGRTLVYNNIQQYKATEKHLTEFAKIERKSDFQFSEIDFEFYTRFVDYLQKPIQSKDNKGKLLFHKDGTPQLSKQPFTQNSVGKHIKVLKVMLNEAKNNDADTSKFYVYTEDVDNVYLNETELKQLKDYDFSKVPHLERVRDWFLLLAWTGSRFSDLQKIDKANIKNEMITYRQQKTNTSVTIPMHPVVNDILQKYNYQMPELISNQKFNDYIKEVCQAAKIDSLESFTRTVGGKLITETMPKYELVSSHTCRRSFCTNMYLRGLDTLMIRSISGHKTEKSFLKYIKVSQQQHAEMMAAKWKEFYK
jgi:integrase